MGLERFFTDDDFEAARFALAQALFKILLGPERGAGPCFGQREGELVAARFTLRVNKGGELPRGVNFLGAEKRACNPRTQVDAGDRQRVKASARKRAAVTAGGRVPSIRLQFDFAVAARAGELVEQRSGQRQVEKIR